MSEKLQEFYLAAQVGLQEHMHQVIESLDPLVEDAQATIGDLAFCFGSSFASVLFELIRTNGEPMTEEQSILMHKMMRPFVDGFTEKVELFVKNDTEKMEVISQ